MNKNSKIPRKATRLKHKSKELDSINKSHKREAYTYHEEEEKEREIDFTRPELQFLSPQLKEAKDLGFLSLSSIFIYYTKHLNRRFLIFSCKGDFDMGR